MNPQTQAERRASAASDQDLENKASFAEMALKLGGKSDDEARRMGAVDKADDQVEQMFAKRYQTVNSPVHRAIWDRELPVELFESKQTSAPPDVDRVMKDSLDLMRKHVQAGTNHDEKKKVPQSVLDELGEVATSNSIMTKCSAGRITARATPSCRGTNSKLKLLIGPHHGASRSIFQRSFSPRE